MKTTKKTKPLYKVDLTQARDANDIFAQYGVTKVEAGVPIERFELDAIISSAIELRDMIDNAMEQIVDFLTSIPEEATVEVKKKKLPWYKRFWRWLTRKK